MIDGCPTIGRFDRMIRFLSPGLVACASACRVEFTRRLPWQLIYGQAVNRAPQPVRSWGYSSGCCDRRHVPFKSECPLRLDLPKRPLEVAPQHERNVGIAIAPPQKPLRQFVYAAATV